MSIWLNVFKLDIMKAFDSVARWDYLNHVLQKLGFGARWQAWVSALVYTTVVFVNGSRGELFDVIGGV